MKQYVLRRDAESVKTSARIQMGITTIIAASKTPNGL
jgi:hypothetical protein